MGVAVELLDGIVTMISSSPDFSSIDVNRQLLPDIEKKDLATSVIVTLQNKSSMEVSRSNEMVSYIVGIGFYYPCTTIADYETALDLLETLHDWILDRDNRNITLSGGVACLNMPWEMSSPFDPSLLNEANTYFAITEFTYTFTKSRI
jgi:hypothetical protein